MHQYLDLSRYPSACLISSTLAALLIAVR